MPQFANLVLKDNANANVTFIPRDITNGVATAINSAGVPLGEKQASFAASRTATGRRKVTLKLVIPVVQDVVVAGVSKPTVVRTSYVDVTFTVDGTSNTAERQDLLAYAKSLLADATQIAPMVTDLSAPF
jgi:hypothetical protein